MNEVAKNILIRAGMVPGDKENLKVGILATGGAQRGTFSAGVLSHMIDMGLADKFDVAVGISASAPNIAHFLAKNKTAVATYWEDDIGGLINPWRFWRIIDLNFLERALRSKKSLDVYAVLNNPTEFYVGVTNLQGKGELINVKKEESVVESIIASCSVPIFWNKPCNLEGNLYLDGWTSMPLPVKEVAERFGLTDLLVIINSTPEAFPEEHSWLEKLMAYFQIRKFSKEFSEMFKKQKVLCEESLSLVNSGILPNGCRVFVVHPSYDISKSCENVETLKDFVEEGKRKAKDFF